MKPKFPAFPRRLVPTSAAMLAVFAMSSPLQAATFTWTGAVSGAWTPASGNWSPNAVFNNTADLSFNTVANGNMFLAFSRTVRSLSFGADIDSDVSVSFQISSGGSTGYNLTFDTDVVGGNATVTVASGATGNITLGNGGLGGTNGNTILADNLDVVHNGSGLLQFNRAITGTGFGITKTGTGTMVFNSVGSSPNTFSGDLNINEGRLIANGFVVATDINNAANVNLGGGALEVRNVSGSNKDYNLVDLHVTSASTLAYNNTNSTSYSLTFSGANAFDLGAELKVQNISANTAVANAIIISRNVSGAGSMIVEGFNDINSATTNFSLGRVALGGTNTSWTGALDIRKGTADIYGDAANMNDFSGNIIIGDTGNAFGAGLLLSPTANSNIIFTNDVTVRSGGFRTIRSGVGPFIAGGDTFYTFNGDFTLEGDLNLHIDANNSDRRITIGGDISGAGGLNITKGNNGFVRLSGDNSYSGATTIGTGAVLNILSASGNAIGNSSAVSFAGAGSTLVFNSTNETIGSLASSGTDGAINLGANTLTTGGNNTSTSYGGTITGTGGGLIKTGTGTMTLTGANTHTGDTAVTAGKLVVTNSIGNSAVTVSGTGTILATDAAASFGSTIAIQNGAILAPGDATTAGTATVTGTSTFNNGSIFSWDIDDAGTGYDKLVTSDVLGQATAGDAVFRIVASDALVSQNFWNTTKTWSDIFTTDGTSAIADWDTLFGNTVTVVNSSFTPITTAGYGSFSVSGSTLTWTAVPEPTSALAGLLLTAGLLRRRRQGNGRSVVS